jgi:hypothetical protein
MSAWRGKGAQFQNLTHATLEADANTSATKERPRAAPKLKSDIDRTFPAPHPSCAHARGGVESPTPAAPAQERSRF